MDEIVKRRRRQSIPIGSIPVESNRILFFSSQSPISIKASSMHPSKSMDGFGGPSASDPTQLGSSLRRLGKKPRRRQTWAASETQRRPRQLLLCVCWLAAGCCPSVQSKLLLDDPAALCLSASCRRSHSSATAAQPHASLTRECLPGLTDGHHASTYPHQHATQGGKPQATQGQSAGLEGAELEAPEGVRRISSRRQQWRSQQTTRRRCCSR